MALCKICGETDENEFYSSIKTYCKKHWKERVRNNRRKKLDYYREHDRKRGNRQPASYLKQYRKDNPQKYKATNAVNNALRDGRLTKGPCFMCGSEKTVAHHPDYTKPLDVIWLCQACHKSIHAYEDAVNEIRNTHETQIHKAAANRNSERLEHNA